MASKPALRATRLPAWLWLMQRVSGLLISGLLMTHMVLNHFVDTSTVIDVGFVEANLRKTSLLFVDSSLLLLALFHGQTGLRNVLYDFFTGARARRLIAWGCAAIGTLFFAFGVAVLVVVLNR